MRGGGGGDMRGSIIMCIAHMTSVFGSFTKSIA
jgi:hypothetical protein